MDCPRCDGTMERYRFQGREAVSCEDCGFIDVPADHQYQHATRESWASAMKRYYES